MKPSPPDVRSIFGQALEIASPAGRAAYLDEACAGDAGLRAEVEALIQCHGRAGGFMGRPAGGEATADFEPIAERPGTAIGPYKLMEQIGEGGMGLVFVAEQQHPVRRKVALKIIKPGMDSRDVIARFEAERQALALMDHPNIARVFDAGTTDSGRPYFVMELVKGIPIVEYCDAQRLTTRERLDLFVSVCQAVQHAHGKGIIHRDLKPSNILVAPHDGEPVVKVIDFGVAKAIGQQLTERTIYTRFAQMIGTPLYMSPEQAELNALDVDVRSDVYSLGVLLYELLTGTTPFERQRFATAAFDEIRRIIKEEEPPRPSTRLSTLGETLSKVSAQRKTEPAKLSALVRGDLDWIVMKALEKDRRRRYETASGLAADVRRFLAEEPIEARPPSASYRFRKFARRHRVMLTTGATVAAALLLGTAISVWQAVRARREERNALVAKRAALNAERAAVEQRDAATARRKEAEAARENLRRTLYAADMGLIQAAWDGGRHREATRLLEREKAENPDLLGFEWDYWMRRSHQASRTISLPRSSMVYSTGFTGDGSRMVANSEPVRVQLKGKPLQFRKTGWEVRDVASGQVLASVALPEGNASDLAVLDRDGSRLALAVTAYDDAAGTHEHRLVVVETATGRRVVHRTLGRLLDRLEFSPDGRRLAGLVSPHADEDKYGPGDALIVWDAETGAEIRSIPGVFPRDQRPALSPDGKLVAATIEAGGGPSSRDVKAWDLDSGREAATFPTAGSVDGVALAFSPDGATLAGVGAYPAGDVLHVWDVATARSRFSIPLGSLGVTARAAFSPDGRRIACAFNQFRVGVWDAAEGKPVAVYEDDLGEADAIAFGRDGRELLAVDKIGTVKAWDADADPGVRSLDAEGWVFSLKVSPDGRRIAGLVGQTPSSKEKVVKIWDATGRFVRSFEWLEACEADEVWSGSLSWSPRGDRIVCTTRRARRPGGIVREATVSGGSLSIWDIEGKRLFRLDEPDVGFADPSLSADGTLVAAVRVRGTIRSMQFEPGQYEATVWDLPAGRIVTTVPDCAQAHLDPAGRRLVGFARSPDRSWRGFVWDAQTGTEITRLALPDPRRIPWAHSLVFSPDGRRVAASLTSVSAANLSDYELSLAVWDVSSGKLRQLAQGVMGAVAFSPDGSRIACANGSHRSFTPLGAEVGLWDAATGRQLLTLKGHRHDTAGSDNGIAFTPDGHQLVSAVLVVRSPTGTIPLRVMEIRTWDATPWAGPPDVDRAPRR